VRHVDSPYLGFIEHVHSQLSPIHANIKRSRQECYIRAICLNSGRHKYLERRIHLIPIVSLPSIDESIVIIRIRNYAHIDIYPMSH
jgi:hypothetical protein